MESTFTFLKHEYDLEQGSASFFYQLQTPNQTYKFVETIHFPKLEEHKPKLTNILDNLLLMLGISYYKLTCAKKIETTIISLTKEQADFWNVVYTKGLGEFFYKNNIDFHNLVQFPYSANVIARNEETRRFAEASPLGGKQSQQDRHADARDDDKSLLLFGGGKDSIVSAELLKKRNKPFTAFVVNSINIQEETLKIVGCDVIRFQRKIDPQLFELNKHPDMYNGHVPATAMIDFLAVLASYLYGYNYIVASNESSANYGNTQYLGEEINHQWSKSLEFEKLFQNYLKENITPDITYFSLLRPLTELNITKIFVEYPEYFPYFSSCNKNFTVSHAPNLKTNSRWCCTCPKCLFIFILLSAFLPKEKTIAIFGSDLYENEQLLPTLKALLGITPTKPFECVGTAKESLLAMQLAYENHSYENDFLMQVFEEEVFPKHKEINKTATQLLTPQKVATIPERFQEIYTHLSVHGPFGV